MSIESYFKSLEQVFCLGVVGETVIEDGNPTITRLRLFLFSRFIINLYFTSIYQIRQYTNNPHHFHTIPSHSHYLDLK